MTTQHKDPRAVIEQLVKALEQSTHELKFGNPRTNETDAYRYSNALIHECDAALTAGREALAEEREVGYGLYIALNGELRLEYPVEASARGWCSEKTGSKIMDPTLALAIRDEVQKLYTYSQASEPTPEGKQLQTKFNLEDRVWFMKDNKPTEAVISAIEIFFVNTNQDQITYNAKKVERSASWLDYTKLQEAWLFRSKTELLNSL